MSKFMLLLYDNPANIAQFQSMSPEEMQKATEKYMAWAKKPFTVDSKRLAEDAGKVIRVAPGGKPRTTDGPFSETKAARSPGMAPSRRAGERVGMAVSRGAQRGD